MHELSIAQALHRLALEETARAGLDRLVAARVRLGEYSGVVPESLMTCWRVLTGDDNGEGPRLEMEITPLTARCRDCGREFRVADLDFRCPNCQGANHDTISGTEMTLTAIEAE